MNDKLWEIFLFIIWALGMLGTIVYFCYEDQSGFKDCSVCLRHY